MRNKKQEDPDWGPQAARDFTCTLGKSYGCNVDFPFLALTLALPCD